MPKQILFIVPYPKGEAPSQRFRFEQYLPFLLEQGFEYDLKTFYSEKAWGTLHQKGHFLKKTGGIISAFFLRFILLFKLHRYTHIFIHREGAPIGPPILEWFIAKIVRKQVIYDFDDAIWLPNYSEANASYQRLKYYKKVNKIMKWASKVSAGNDYLAKYAKQFNENVVVNPTTIDTENYHNPSLYPAPTPKSKLVIGWTGTLTTAKYLHEIVLVLEDLSQKYDFEFCVISNEAPEIELQALRFVKWKKETEIEDLLRFDIGVMPLTEDRWSNGKCGFKALQYMSLGIPTIASPVGVNPSIIDHGVNGFLCSTQQDWKNAFEYLLADEHNRHNMHEAAREKIRSNYSVLSNKTNFLNLFKP
jgi:glycosyltransferase involved in cell wall biosynthesis